MGVLDKIGGFLGGGLGGKIAEIIGSKMENKAEAELLAIKIEAAVAEREHEIEKLLIEREGQIAAGQIAVNQEEAKSDSLLKSGWRPMVGWVCVTALAYQMVFRPLLEWVSGFQMWPVPPALDLETLLTLLFGLLGLGAFRTYEKVSVKT